MSREVTNLECALMGLLMVALTAITLLCTGCASSRYVREVEIPAHKLIICDYDTLQELYPEYRKKNQILWGCADIINDTIWCTPSFWDKTQADAGIYWHEVRHLIDGEYHK